MVQSSSEQKVLTSRTYLLIGFAVGAVFSSTVDLLPAWLRIPWMVLSGLLIPTIGIVHVKRGGVIEWK